MITRRAILSSAVALALSQGVNAVSADASVLISFDVSNPSGVRFDADAFNIVGIYDFDWLLMPEFERTLDLMASSPGAIGGVRAFGIFTMGEREDLKPGTGGIVWTDASLPPDFSLPFAALDELVRRGLTPFISLGFFPPSVSSSPISPPEDYDEWKQLLRAFFNALADDHRFGPAEIKTWSFEVWNEPNEGRFWSGTFEQYLDLYRATSAVVTELHPGIRLGGPAMAYKPESEAEDGPETMARFLELLHDEPDVLCEFISYHRKGTVDSSPPDPRRLLEAAGEISDLIDKIVPERAKSLALINNEADEKIGFEVPYFPRMDSFAASWLTSLSTTHANLTTVQGRTFSAVQDNANLQLIQKPFDGRRSIYSTISTDDRTNLVKTSGAIFYDLLPMLGGEIILSQSINTLFPETDLHAISTVSARGVGLLATWHPAGDPNASRLPANFTLKNLPWPSVNVARWQIDATHSNAFSIAQALGKTEYSTADATVIRGNQELALLGSVQHGVETHRGAFELSLSFAPYDTVFFWLTPTSTVPIAAPASVIARELSGGIELTWHAVEHDQLLGYEISSNGGPIAGPIRPCSWIDSIAAADASYAVRAVSASGIASEWVNADVSGT